MELGRHGMKKFRELWDTFLVRPLIYMSFTRIMWGLFLSLLVSHIAFLLTDRALRSWLFLLAAALLFLGAWLSFLQLDGMKLPRLEQMRHVLDRPKRPSTGDLIDYIDEKPERYGELSDDERHLCLLFSDVLCGVIFVGLSILFP